MRCQEAPTHCKTTQTQRLHRSLINEWSCFQDASAHISALSVRLLHHPTEKNISRGSDYKEIPALTMEEQQRNPEAHDGDAAEDVAAAIEDSIPDLHLPDSPSPSSSCSPLPPSASASALLALASPATRRSISMGDFRRVTGALLARSEPPSTSATAPSSKLVTPSSSMEFEAARRRLLEVEERQRVIREMERRLEELREMFVRSEQQVVIHGELVTRISSTAQQGELYVAENSQRLKKGLKFKKHRPTIIFSSMLGLRTCLPWPVKLK
ncbi:TMF-regulated nuclear protein 1 [Oryzias melastigma]|uniref:TMF-regulated nuclear protein 1 n=1 Tax=Oryzias melastigma TaxID=30732 RepID=A0A834C2Q8_ORYME|nr:TMF-regulated nuclear protein 1 [Oryzias melastigma]KAF6721797.1 TMF-regulated nuclear protein 1 [Oryzias melastigma]